MLFKIMVKERLDMWRAEATRLKFEKGYSWTETAAALKNFFPGKTDRQIHETVRGYLRLQPEYLKKNPVAEKQEVVGIIGDMHAPFVHPNYIHFLEDTFMKYGVTRIVHAGDIVDLHSISRWQSEPDSHGAMTEFEMAQKDIEIYTRAFPNVEICLGNHDLIPQRQAASLGMPAQFLKSFKELWNLPKGWTVDERFIINDVLYEHGTGCSGNNAAITKATNAMMSCCIGHIHSAGCVQYKSNTKSLIFGLSVGTGVDIDSFAFRYGRYNKNREVMGCGIVNSSSEAHFVPMSDRWFRNGIK